MHERHAVSYGRSSLMTDVLIKLSVAALSIIVFITVVFFLMLPAITFENTVCGYEEHIHNDSCYTEELVPLSDIEESTEAETAVTQQQGQEYTTETTEEDTSLLTDETSDELSESTQAYEENTSAALNGDEDIPDGYVMVRTFICEKEEHVHTDICFSSSDDVLQIAEDIEPYAAGETVQRVNFDDLDPTGDTAYVIYTYYNSRYYAIDGNGNAVQITLNGNTLNSASFTDNYYWNFTRQNSNNVYKIINVGTTRCFHVYYNSSSNTGVTTGGAYDATLISTGSGSSKTFAVYCNSKDYAEIATSGGRVIFRRTASSSSAAQFYIAKVTKPVSAYHVWFDGTCGGLMSLYQAGNVYQSVSADSPVVVLPSTFTSPSKYDYVLKGWYDIKNNKYYKPGERVTVTDDTVFYADWIAATYDIGQYNEHVVKSLDTDSFIRTDLFDYSAVFNVQAASHTGSVSASGHDETWSVVRNANVPYGNAPSLGFIFRDWDTGNKHISYASNRARLNDNQADVITSEIIDYVYDMSGKNIIDVLFSTSDEVIGKTYVGKANYLYQFMEEGLDNYDGKHNGYYYYDATYNAASYNQSAGRFYIYDYLERTSDSLKDSFDANGNPTAAGAYSDFLPFNSPYVNNSNNKKIVTYSSADGSSGNYQYDAKATNQQSSPDNAGTNYWFGMKSEISFYLPNNTGEKDEFNNYGNISTHGDHMKFEFHGDDDLWVFIDGELVMDVGGLHGIMEGTIDFSTGTVTTGNAVNNDAVSTPVTKTLNLSEGDHTLTIYYMERGGSQSNCAIYFNIAPRYDMKIEKVDAVSGEKINGAQFSVFTDEDCVEKANLWDSEYAYNNNAAPKNVFESENGVVSFWGISPGKVYYIKETKAPDGYPVTDDIVRVAMNNLGGVVCTTDSLRGENEEHTDGFDVIDSVTDEGIHLLSVKLTNQKPVEKEEFTNVRVMKSWSGADASSIPGSVTVYLQSNGVRTGKKAVLSKENEWTYTWTELPIKDENGDDIDYSVEESHVPGFNTKYSVSDFSDSWMTADAFRDGDTFIIFDASSGKALSVNGSGNGLVWIDFENAKNTSSAQWTSVAAGMGFYLINGDGKYIVLDSTTKFIPAASGNRVMYFYNSRLFAQNGNQAYYMNESTSASTDSKFTLALYKKSDVEFSGTEVMVSNVFIPEDEQIDVRVHKTWSDGYEEHINSSITVVLYSDGEPTGYEAVLDQSNGWSAVFEGLDYYDEDGVFIQYTVEEKNVPGFIPEYDSVITLTAGSTYRFENGGKVFASDSSGNLLFADDAPGDEYQQWVAVQSGTSILLRNVGNGRYLQYRSSRLQTSTSGNATYGAVKFFGGKLIIRNSYYVTYSNGNVSVISNESSATSFYIYEKPENSEHFGISLSVNNRKASYILPETGSSGALAVYISGSILVVFSLSLALYGKLRNKRRKAFDVT
ncbi:MAG: Cna B-type domain-containing protein [Ruminococcaceae bacterium]|nr:Cna B-type domain-containing protein [Oscillospiraceae bacterium]